MFQKILIANRGEIAVRILRACKMLGIKTVAVHSVIDESLMHVRFADESVCIGPNRAADSYLNVASILSAAELTGCDALHPGVGFLSENAKFAKMVNGHGIKFIGPDPLHLSEMGDKILAKKKMMEYGVPVVKGSDGDVQSVDAAKRIAEEIGYPVLFKAASGGGGKGMKVAESISEIEDAFRLAKSEARVNFGDDTIYMERYLKNPRHIEIQIIADSFGNVVHLGERDCSIQRNHQKLIEESPCTALSPDQRQKIGEIAVRAVEKIGYVGVGTLEFLFEDGEFFFMEMNTRLQVEHGVSEELTGIDIVSEQIRIAAGERLSFGQSDIRFSGHVMEFRINAEDSETFLPSPGRIEELFFPGGNGIRVDSHIYSEYVIPPFYDSLIAKLMVRADSRQECLSKARCALDELVIDGISTTAELYKKLLRNTDMIRGDVSIHWLEDDWKNYDT
ncbi:MAG: acetyl-CoA carboxylase biotin carboxylase subunit [Holosporales bacterium]|jgi:acetyl-CoA carboxylase biotin carboxylase subunit|nr:acetyl-CoA carboxylase biotin carboxylase subunit [Holosporales bacterium]